MGLRPSEKRRIERAIQKIRYHDYVGDQPREITDEVIRRAVKILQSAIDEDIDFNILRQNLMEGKIALTASYLVDTGQKIEGVACGSGCFFCCIDARQVTCSISEARMVAEAIRERPKGTDFHPNACPALNPETKVCNAYECRPLICAGYVAFDSDLCKESMEAPDGEKPTILSAIHPEAWIISQAMLIISLFLLGKLPACLDLKKAIPMILDGASNSDLIKHAPADPELSRLSDGVWA